MEGRRYSDGLHQAIEAKEGVKVEAATQTLSLIHIFSFVLFNFRSIDSL